MHQYLEQLSQTSRQMLDNFKNSEYPFGFTGGLMVILLLALVLLGVYWSDEPDRFDVDEITRQLAPETDSNITIGSSTTATTIHLMETLLNKRGGYLSNDVMPPSLWLDNIPNWEFGVLVQVRDLSRVLRNDYSRSQTQSLADPDLELVLDDARNYIDVVDRSFDVIVTDVTNLKYKRNPYLYTREYFEIMRGALTADGVAAAWLPVGGWLA